MDVSRVNAAGWGRPLGTRRWAVAICAVTLAASASVLAPSTAAADGAVQDAVATSVAAADADGIEQSVAVVDRATGARVAGSGGDEQYISESIVKLFTVAYYEVKAGGHPDGAMAARLRTMIIHSDDAIESSLWNTDIVPTMAARYGLTNTSNGPKTGPHDWGWELITADDEADFLFKMSNDPAVAPLLMDAMANVAPTGADGFDQSFGMNALTGDHGSKQGWTDVGSAQRVQIHSVGWTDRYFVAILQTSTGTGYDTMRAASTRTARAVLAAEGQGPTATDGASGTTSTVDAAEPEPVAPDPTDSDPTDSEPAPAPATTVPAAPAATAPATAAPVPPVPSAGARFLAALSQVGRDLGAAMTAPLRPLADD